jgi:hypothetical protein
MLVANYFPRMMAKAAGYMRTVAPSTGTRRIEVQGPGERSLLD